MDLRVGPGEASDLLLLDSCAGLRVGLDGIYWERALFGGGAWPASKDSKCYDDPILIPSTMIMWSE